MPIFNETRRIYDKPKGKGISRCPHPSCRATSPLVRRANEHELQSISDDIRNLAGANEIQICGYCSRPLVGRCVGTDPHSFVLIGSQFPAYNLRVGFYCALLATTEVALTLLTLAELLCPLTHFDRLRVSGAHVTHRWWAALVACYDKSAPVNS